MMMTGLDLRQKPVSEFSSDTTDADAELECIKRSRNVQDASCVSTYSVKSLYNIHRVPKKLVHLAHIDNLVNSQRIFKILSLTNSACRKFAIKLSLKNSTPP